ncbi:MAG TPA: hypothetical protein VFW63_08570 [Acidimicrobiales bacterium]|nr:hypothetical protein [Acidimicrobiales bacterium]
MQGGREWVWPYWLERQADPTSPSFVPRGEVPVLANVTHRTWTAVGTLDSRHRAVVDPRGLVTPVRDGWSLDWWVGADDRWHVPSREVAVRQHLLGPAPVVETAMSVPSGDVVHRAYAVRRSTAEGGGPVVVVEIENASPVPVALALAVRPYTPEGVAAVGRIDLQGAVVAVDGGVALLLPRPPARVAAGTSVEGDSATTVLAGEAGERWPGPVHDPGGLAQAAFVYPLAHGATLRAVVPLGDPARGRRPRRAPAAASFPAVLPPAAAVADGWRAQGERGMRLTVPDPRLGRAVEAARRSLLVLHGGDEVATGPMTDPPSRFAAAAVLLGALGRYGHHDEVAGVLRSYPWRQAPDGHFPDPGDRRSGGAACTATGAALVAMADHWRLARDADTVTAAVEAIADAAQWLDRTHRDRAGRARGDGRSRGRRRAVLPRRHGAPGGPGPGGPGGDGDAEELWGLAGLQAAAELLAVAGQADGARDAARLAAAREVDVGAAGGGGTGPPAGPVRQPGDLAADVLAAVALGVAPADDGRVVAAAEAWRRRGTAGDGRALLHPADDGSLDPAATLRLAAVELRAGDRTALERLDWVVEQASATFTWPEAVHPRVAGGCAGDGQDGRVAAHLMGVVRDLLVVEATPADGTTPTLALSTLVPDAWLGQGWEVHAAPTAHGTVSYAVRWHGERVALLWEVRPHPGVGTVLLTAPGLDPSWSTTEAAGEALLGPVPRPPEASGRRAEGPAAAEGGSFG